MSNISAKIIAFILFVWFGGMALRDIFGVQLLNVTVKIIIVSVLFILLSIAIGVDYAEYRHRKKLMKKVADNIFG